MLLATTNKIALLVGALSMFLPAINAQDSNHEGHDHGEGHSSMPGSSVPSATAASAAPSATPGSSAPATTSVASPVLNKLCAPSPSTMAIAACSMRASCQASGMSTDTCSDLVILQQACTFDQALVTAADPAGCASISALCAADASCSRVASLKLFSSLEAQSDIYAICTSMAMKDCSKCNISRTTTVPATASTTLSLGCDTLDVYGTL
ncbi:hypothetical protein HDV05_000292, partial [Chytridiales sp. JEL 0842]